MEGKLIDQWYPSLTFVAGTSCDRKNNVEAFKKTMTQAWAVKKRIVIRMIGSDRFIFQFLHWKDKEKVLAGKAMVV